MGANLKRSSSSIPNGSVDGSTGSAHPESNHNNNNGFGFSFLWRSLDDFWRSVGSVRPPPYKNDPTPENRLRRRNLQTDIILEKQILHKWKYNNIHGSVMTLTTHLPEHQIHQKKDRSHESQLPHSGASYPQILSPVMIKNLVIVYCSISVRTVRTK